jgi:hypothetical protein
MAEVDNTGRRIETHAVEASLLPVRRTAWGAVFAGVFAALSVQLLLGMLGTAIGLTAIYTALGDPGGLGAGWGIGAGIWWLITVIVSLFIGGWVAGRLAGVANSKDGALHGFVTWGVTTFVGLYLATTAMGLFVGGAMAAVGQAVDGALAGRPATQQVEEFYQFVEQDVRQLSQQADDPRQAQQEIMSAVRQNFRPEDPFIDERGLANFLQDRANLRQQEAQQTAQRWQRRWREPVMQAGPEFAVHGTMDRLRQDGVEAEDATRILTVASWWAFFGMLLAAAASVMGGWIGTQRDLPYARTRTTTTTTTPPPPAI